MKHFRLKKEAIPFFKEKYAHMILTFDQWQKNHIDINALEEVEPAYIKYGHALQNQNEVCTNVLGGWDEKEKSHLHFTLCFPDIEYRDHERFTQETLLRDLMDRIQNEVNEFYNSFLSTKINNTNE